MTNTERAKLAALLREAERIIREEVGEQVFSDTRISLKTWAQCLENESRANSGARAGAERLREALVVAAKHFKAPLRNAQDEADWELVRSTLEQ